MTTPPLAQSQHAHFIDNALPLEQQTQLEEATNNLNTKCTEIFAKINTLTAIVGKREISALEDNSQILVMRTALQALESSQKALREKNGSINIKELLDQVRETLEHARQGLSLLESGIFNLLTRQLPSDMQALLAIEETPVNTERIEQFDVTSARHIEAASKQSTALEELLKLSNQPQENCHIQITNGEDSHLEVIQPGIFAQGMNWWQGTHHDVNHTAQVIYNVCFQEISDIERRINTTFRVQKRLDIVKENLAKVRSLLQIVGNILSQSYPQPVQSGEATPLGMQTLLATSTALASLYTKLQRLHENREHIQAAALRQQCSITIDACRREVTCKGSSFIPTAQNRLLALQEYVQNKQQGLTATSPEANQLQEATRLIEETLKEFQSPAVPHPTTTTTQQSRPHNDPLPAIHGKPNEIQAYVTALKQRLTGSLDNDLAEIATIPEDFLNLPAIAAVVRSLAQQDVTELTFGNTAVLRGQQRILQRKIDDYMETFQSNKTPPLEVLNVVHLLHNSTQGLALGVASYASLKNAVTLLSKAGVQSLPTVPIELLAPTQAEEASAIVSKELNPILLEQRFTAAYQSVCSAMDKLEGSEKERLAALLCQYQNFSSLLDGPVSLGETNELARQTQQLSLALKTSFDSAQDIYFTQLERSLVQMTEIHNQIGVALEQLRSLRILNTDPRAVHLHQLKHQIQDSIHAHNLRITQTALTTNAATATKSHVISYIASVEKKLALCRKALEAGNSPKQQAIRADADLSTKIRKDLDGPSTLIVKEEDMANLHKKYAGLVWGEDFTNTALCTPANWTIQRTALIKYSKTGRAHVAVSILEPLDIDERGGVPAGLRDDENCKKRATNLIKTTAYICPQEGQRPIEHISFRGGQFPTKEAAKQALRHILREPTFASSRHLHINVLLTPTDVPKVEDKALLMAHKTNIEAALKDLAAEASTPVEQERLRTLLQNLAVSDFGVNAGSVGEISPCIRPVGWHKSIEEYCNPASQKLNKVVYDMLSLLNSRLEGIQALPTDMAAVLNRLGPILQVGQDLEAVFAKNDYANAKVGQNQFKMPALWKALDDLIGVPCYTDCKSGKDRTGKVEGCAQEYLDEIDMNTIDQRQELAKTFDELCTALPETSRSTWEQNRAIVTSACFKKEELRPLAQYLERDGKEVFERELRTSVLNKINAVKDGLGVTNGKGFMRYKNISANWYSTGTTGIPEHSPNIESQGISQGNFPDLTVQSIYPKHTTTHSYESLQRESINRRLSQIGSLAITQINTGTPGFKVEGGTSLDYHSAGFHPDYVIQEVLQADFNTARFVNNCTFWLGLDELNAVTRAKHLAAISQIVRDSKNNPESGLKTLLETIAYDKAVSLKPMVKVST